MTIINSSGLLLIGLSLVILGSLISFCYHSFGFDAVTPVLEASDSTEEKKNTTSSTGESSASDVSTNSSSSVNSTANATTTTSNASNAMLLYEYPELGLKIKYPSNWEKVEYGKAVKAYGEGVIANLLAPLEGPSDKFRDFVILKIENLTSHDLAKTPSNISFGGNPTYQVISDRPNLANKSDIIVTMKEWTPINDKALVVELNTEKAKYAQYLPLAMEIFKSVEINGIGTSSALASAAAPSQNESSVSINNNMKASSIIEN